MVAFLFLTLITPPPLQTPDLVEARVRSIIAKSGAEVAVVFRRLDGTSELLIDPDKPFHAASTMKVPVMIELFRQAEAGMLRLDEPLSIRNEFRSIVDGSPYRLSEGDDSDREVYANVGKTMTLRRLNELMITVSSNFAANLLIERLGVENVKATVKRLGADGMKVLRGVEDGKAFEKGLNNETTARGLAILFEKLAAGKAVGPSADRDMIEVLKRQKFNDAIPAGVPAGTSVAHKTGSITRIQHDGGIVYGPRPYVLVVLVRGIQDEKVSKALIAEISRGIAEGAEKAESGSVAISGGNGLRFGDYF
jgi:beta-lactamase class A